MGNIIQYQVHVRTNDNKRKVFPGRIEAWDSESDARRVYERWVAQCRRGACKEVHLIRDDEDKGKETLACFPAAAVPASESPNQSVVPDATV
jgi:hypothetical protein